MTAKILYKY